MYKSKPKYIIEDFRKYLVFKDDFELLNSNITKNYEFFLFYFYKYSNSDRAINFINSKKWDLIYIDGSHDFEDVNNDFNECFSNLNINGLIVIDDSSLYLDYDTKYIEKNFKLKTFKGHPGPSKVVLDIISMNKLEYLFGVGHNNVFLKKS